jgi:hypothetical protein
LVLVDNPEVGCGRLAVAARFQVILEALAFADMRKSGAFECGDVQETILAAVFGSNKAVTLGRVEPLNGSDHVYFQFFIKL